MMPIPIAPDGRFAGYASVFGQLDQGGDIVMRGAFAASLAAKGSGGIRLLFQHDPKEPVGIWEVLREDGYGLWAEGRLIEGVPRADALRRLIEKRALDGLSIGFRTRRATRQPGTGHRLLHSIDLFEISIVTFPMMADARISPGVQPPDPEARLKRSLGAAISILRS